MDRLEFVLQQIKEARGYTNRLLERVEPADWFRQGAGGVTHIGWQAGHLAMAEYRLGMERIRGHRDEDESLISTEFLACYGKDSIPDPAPEHNFSTAEIREIYDRVHEQMLRELSHITDAELDAAPLKPHPLFDDKFGSLCWCARHEMLHAGQIGLIRRQLGAKPIW